MTSTGLPVGATLERVLPSFALYDVSHLLPRHESKKYEKRDPSQIKFVVIHKSGADGPPGFAGLVASTNYVTKWKRTRSKPNGYPGATYTFWIPQTFDEDAKGRPVIYRSQPDDVTSWHTGRMNPAAIAICFQGAYDGDGGLIVKRPSKQMIRAGDELLDYCAGRYGIALGERYDESGWALTGHFEHGKPVCPGDALKEWLMLRRSPAATAAFCSSAPGADEVDTRKFQARERQLALRLLGYDPGPLDGIWGVRSRAALEEFQEAYGLDPDGAWGDATASLMLEALRVRGVSVREHFFAPPT